MNQKTNNARKYEMLYIHDYKVTVKRVEEFYETVFVKALTQDDAYEKVEQMSSNGEIEFDYFKESDCLEESIVDIEKL